MRASFRLFAFAALAPHRRARAERPVYRAAGGRGPVVVRRELRRLPHARSARLERGAAARRRRLHAQLGRTHGAGSRRVPERRDAAAARVSGQPRRPDLPQPRGVLAPGERREGRLRGAHGDDDVRDRQRRERRDARQASRRRSRALRPRRVGRRRGPHRAHAAGQHRGLQAGDGRGSARARVGRLADDPRRLSRLELQRARSDHARQRRRAHAPVGLVDDRRRLERARADRPRRRALCRQPGQRDPGAQCRDRRAALGEPRRPERRRTRALRGLAIYDDKVFVATSDARLVALDARTGQTVWETIIGDRTEGEFWASERPDRHQGQSRPGHGQLHALPQGEVLHQRVRREGRARALAVPHGRDRRRARRATPGAT